MSARLGRDQQGVGDGGRKESADKGGPPHAGGGDRRHGRIGVGKRLAGEIDALPLARPAHCDAQCPGVRAVEEGRRGAPPSHPGFAPKKRAAGQDRKSVV